MKGSFQRYKIIPLLLFSAILIGCVSTYANGWRQQPDGQPYEVKEFNVSTPIQLNVRTSGGNIRIESRYSNKVRVEMYVRKSGHYLTPSDNALKGYDIDISKHGSEIRAIAHHSGMGFHFGSQPSISFVLYTPKASDGDLHTSGGNISIQGLEGNMQTHTSGGNIDATDLNGSYTLKTSGGRISIHKVNGKVRANTSGGSIDVAEASGILSLHTSGGNISLQNVSGEIDGKTSGGNISAKIQKVTNQVSLKTSGGNVNVSIPSDKGYSLELKGGSVHTNLQNFNGTMRNDRVDGTVRGGGPKIILKTSGGSVHLYN